MIKVFETNLEISERIVGIASINFKVESINNITQKNESNEEIRFILSVEGVI